MPPFVDSHNHHLPVLAMVIAAGLVLAACTPASPLRTPLSATKMCFYPASDVAYPTFADRCAGGEPSLPLAEADARRLAAQRQQPVPAPAATPAAATPTTILCFDARYGLTYRPGGGRCAGNDVRVTETEGRAPQAAFAARAATAAQQNTPPPISAAVTWCYDPRIDLAYVVGDGNCSGHDRITEAEANRRIQLIQSRRIHARRGPRPARRRRFRTIGPSARRGRGDS